MFTIIKYLKNIYRYLALNLNVLELKTESYGFKCYIEWIILEVLIFLFMFNFIDFRQDLDKN